MNFIETKERNIVVKTKTYRTSFDWNETAEGIAGLVDIIKKLGYIVYDLGGRGSTYSDYIISNKPIKKYKGKEI